MAGEGAWPALPEDFRRILTGNGPALLAELGGEWWLEADAAAIATIEQPALLVAAPTRPPSCASRPRCWPSCSRTRRW